MTQPPPESQNYLAQWGWLIDSPASGLHASCEPTSQSDSDGGYPEAKQHSPGGSALQRTSQMDSLPPQEDTGQSQQKVTSLSSTQLSRVGSPASVIAIPSHPPSPHPPQLHPSPSITHVTLTYPSPSQAPRGKRQRKKRSTASLPPSHLPILPFLKKAQAKRSSRPSQPIAAPTSTPAASLPTPTTPPASLPQVTCPTQHPTPSPPHTPTHSTAVRSLASCLDPGID